MIVDQQDIDARLDITVLEGVIQKDDIQCLINVGQFLNTMTTAFVHCDGDIGEFLFHLERLVTNLRHCGVGRCDDESFTLTLITSA